jgi:hypothetical protein
MNHHVGLTALSMSLIAALIGGELWARYFSGHGFGLAEDVVVSPDRPQETAGPRRWW